MLACNGHDTLMWSALPEEISRLRETREHPCLPGVRLPETLELTANLKEACEGRELLVFAVPSVYIRSVAAQAGPYVSPGQLLVSVAKGIEPDSFLTMTEVIAQELGVPAKRVCALSGPTHAEEVSRDLPTAIVCAGEDPAAVAAVRSVFCNAVMRPYTNSDVRGVELCGALKNIIALAAGISDGIGYGDNAKAAIITRGMAEIARLGAAMGCAKQSFYGLAGIGDLIVTATSRHSRNNRAGYLIGSGLSAEEAVRQVGMVVEGLNALPAAIGLSERFGVEMPITFAVNDIVRRNQDRRETVYRLMTREYKPETE